MNSLDEVIAALPETAREAAKRVINGAIEAEKELGIKSSSDARREAENTRKRYKGPLKELGIDPDSDDWFKPIAEYKEAHAKYQELSKSQGSKDQHYQGLEAKVAELEKKWLEEAQKAEGLRKERAHATITSKLGEQLKDAYGANHVIKSLIADGRAVYDEEKNDVYLQQGDKRVDLATGIKSMIETGEIEVKVTQRPGAGSSGSGGSTEQTSEDRARETLKRIGVLRS